MTDTDTRTNYTQGLRAVADLLDKNPGVPLPYGRGLSFFIRDDLDEALAIRYLMVDPVTYWGENVCYPVVIEGQLAGLPACVYIWAAAAGVAPVSPRRPPCDPRLGPVEQVSA